MSFIEIIVNPSGNSIVKTIGFEGASCRSASKLLEQALGCTLNEELTSDFHRMPVNSQQELSESQSGTRPASLK